MNIHGDKSQKNTTESSAQSASDRQASSTSKGNLVDNRPLSVIQKMQLESTGNMETPLQFKANKTGLPDQLKSGIENLSGHSMDDVKVHYNSDKPAQLNAHAYAQGTNIHIASGQEKHLPHEAWHVVQQKQGRVKPTLQMKGNISINDDKALEKEADVKGAMSLRTVQRQVTFQQSNIQSRASGPHQLAGYIIQRVNTNIAQQATIESITEAFPILGAKCKTQYDKINHGLTALSPLKSLMKTFKARLEVLKFFRQAMLANGLNGATKVVNQRFISGEAGHITAMLQLRTLIMVHHADPGDIGYIEEELGKVKMKKQQIK